ncbi:MAG TPA: phage portal protein [Thiothrix sp.]|nr:phage portal protein [Thiothrix sp.]
MTIVNRRILHEGATKGRRLGSWGDKTTDAITESSNDLQILRNRVRTLRRDNAWTSRGNSVDGSNVIGTGIRPIAMTSDKAFNESVTDAHTEWARDVSYTNSGTSLYALQLQIRQAKRESGECFVLIKRGRLDRVNNVVPLKFQLLESDYCPLTMCFVLQNGNSIINGVELNSRGLVVAYHFYTAHPNEFYNVTIKREQFIRVPVKDVLHYFDKDRPSQLRGKPKISNSIVTARTFDTYNDAELVRKKSRASLIGTIERDAYDENDYKFDPMTGQPLTEDEGVPLMDLQDGTFHALLAGERLNLAASDDAGSGFRDYQEFQLLQIAASHGVPYQLLTGDWSGINDRVWRAILNQYKREVQQEQELSIIPTVCDPIYREFINRGVMSSILTLPDFATSYEKYKVKHRTQTWEYIHPEQDVNSDIKRLQAGLTSREAIISKRGDHGVTVESIDRERELDKKRELDKNLRSLANFSKLENEFDINDDGVIDIAQTGETANNSDGTPKEADVTNMDKSKTRLKNEED